MAREREQQQRDDERRFKVERQRWAFRFGIGVLGIICTMYFIVQPTLSAFDHRIDLPDGRIVFVIVVMAGSAVWSFDLKDISAFFSGVNISFGRKPDPPSPGPEGGAGDA